jgi:hypothetical protein
MNLRVTFPLRWPGCCYGRGMHSESTLISRVRSEFLEMPGLQLTLPQAARLWGLEQHACRRIIDALVTASFLRWTPRGTVVRTESMGVSW